MTEFSQYLLLLLVSISFTNGEQLNINSVLIDSQLLEEPSKSVFLTFSNGIDKVLQDFDKQDQSFESNDARAFALTQALEAHTTATQSGVASFLTLLGIDFKPYWITNRIYIKNCPANVILALTDFFSDDLLQIQEEKVFEVFRTFDVAPVENIQGETQPGVGLMGGPEMWAQKCTGQNVPVALLDTGCNGNHQDLKNKIILQADMVGGTGIAKDLHGHGSHCAGIIAGTGGTGMAPDAKLYPCKCCEAAGCPQNSLYSCAQWGCCPDRENGCANNPRVASNSWGGGSGDIWFDDCINSWRKANIVPVFAIGNAGPECSTANSPGDRVGCVSVGAIDPSKSCTSFSSRGPAVGTSMTKPDVAAPGSKIISCSNLNNAGYVTMSGTSMACPHVAGMAALIISKDPSLSVAQVERILIDSCVQQLTTTGTTCGNKPDTIFPNNQFGTGLPSCKKALAVLDAMQNSARSLDKEVDVSSETE